MRLRSLILAALFAALTAVGSLIKIPIGLLLVFTLQTFFVFLAGLLLSPRYAMLSQVVYIAIGLLGLPIFSTGGGLTYVLTPSFGFLIGFIVCAGLLSAFTRKDLAALTTSREHRPSRIIRVTISGLTALLAMYVIGIAYMYAILNLYLNSSATLGYVIEKGAGVFIFIDIAQTLRCTAARRSRAQASALLCASRAPKKGR